MNYCSLDEAWGEKKISNNYRDYMIKNNIETFNIINTQENKRNNDIINKPIVNDIVSCDDFMLHIKNCNICQQKVRGYLKPNIIDNLYNLVDRNKDIVILILIGISILLFLNLINNLFRKPFN
jgi:hypothetical protein